MSKENIKIVQIDTDPAVKSIKDLRKELREYKDQMANLEEGSDAFLEIANKAGEVKHQIDEISESVKGASADFGDMVGNVTNVAAGLVGAFEAVAGGLQAMGLESEAIDETIVRMQGLMAVVQGLSAIDDGIKAMDKLATSITGTSKAAKMLKSVLQPKVFLAISAAIAGIVLVWNQWGDKIKEAIPFVEKISDLLGGNKEKIEEARKEQEKFNEELAISDKKVAEILEKRKWDAITQEAQAKIKEYQDNLVILENQLLNIVNKQKSTNDKTIWDKLNEDGKEVLNQIKEIKGEIDDLYTNPKYQKSNQITTPTTPTTPTQKKNSDYGIDLQGDIPLLEVEPLKNAAETIGEDIGRVLAQAEIKARNEKWKEEVENIEKSGNQVFEGLKETMSAFGDSSLGLTAGWIASLDQFQLAFQQTMDIVKNEGTIGWEAYGKVAATSLGGIGTLLNALSQEQDVSNEKGFEQQKKLQIAATTMNMLSGIMAAWTSSMALPAPASFIVGAVQTVATAALGAAQIAKIKAQTMNSAMASGAINPTSVNNMIVPPVQYSAAVQGASTEGAIKDTKVYVTETDIASTMQKVSVQESENTY